MLLWLMIVLLIGLTLGAMILPLYRGNDKLETRDAYDANIYKDQLRAIDRELEEGLIGEEEAEGARIEISRKLLAAADKAEEHPEIAAAGRRLSRRMAMGVALAVPLLAVGLYLHFGSPGLQDMPLEARLETPPEQQRLKTLIARAEQQLKSNPGDGRGWEIMAPIYLRHQMYDKAVDAFNNAIRLLGPSAERLTGLADAKVFANNGEVGDDVLPILKRAIKLNPDQSKAHFWLALHHEQKGRLEEAEKAYTDMLAKSMQGVSWRPIVQKRLDEVRKQRGLPPKAIAGVKQPARPEIKLGDARAKSPPLKGPTAEDMRRAREMSPEDRQAMINTMVENLASRLRDEGGDLASWMRLVNAYNTLGKREEAEKALRDAKKNLQQNQQDVAALDELAKRLGLGS